MPDPLPRPTHIIHPSTSIYFSFVLRCWLTPNDILSGYLLEIPSGHRHAFRDAASLGVILQRHVTTQTFPEQPHDSDT